MSQNTLDEEVQVEIDNIQVDADAFKETSSYNLDLNVFTIEGYFRRSKFVFDPEFQRRYVWDTKQKSRLIESLILNIPVPSILLANNEGDNSFIIIDGKQRLNAIISFMAPNEEGVGFKLSGLEILSSLNGYTYAALCDDPNMARYCSNFQNFVFKATILKNYKENLLYFVFARLNSGSVALSSQELRYALYPGGFSKFINDASHANPQLGRVLGLKGKDCDPRMRDCELLCRYYAFKYFLSSYGTYVGKLLDDTYKWINKQWDSMEEQVKKDFVEFAESVDFCYRIFGQNAFRPYSPSKGEYTSFNRLVYDLLVVFFSEHSHRQTVEEKGIDVFEQFFKDLFSCPDFAYGFTPVTSEHDKTMKRFDVFRSKFADKFGA